MNFLFAHQNFPGQYLHLANHLAAIPGNRVVCITQRPGDLPGIHKALYQPHRKVTKNIHHYLAPTEQSILNAQSVARAASDLKRSGFKPDVMIGHNGWGEIWYLKDIYPNVPLLGYFEFFYHTKGADVGFDSSEPLDLDTTLRIRTKNIGNLLGLDIVDLGQCPTQWQKSLYPERYQSLLYEVHEGIDTTIVAPDPGAKLWVSADLELTRSDEVVTFVARNLEPYRGFPSFMRTLPELLERRPKAHVVIVGGDEVSYGSRLPNNQTYKQKMIDELGSDLDMSRIHFLGRVPYKIFLQALQVSRAHVYLTYPFVLSWSMLEAMAAECLVIGSSTQPVTEVITHGENGLLVDFFDVSGITQTLIAVLEDPNAFDHIRRNARKTIVENYDLKSVCLPQQLKLLEEVIIR
ncbi:MAG TPA: glycosyltransferase family 4 protein [Methylophilaceae bacterium]|nr:glycosyltransferase family 4 protein [Methylophilaceae bacterium]